MAKKNNKAAKVANTNERAAGDVGVADLSEKYPITSAENAHDAIRFYNPEIGLVREFSLANDGDAFYDLADQYYFARKGSHLNMPEFMVASTRLVREKAEVDSEELAKAEENIDAETKATKSPEKTEEEADLEVARAEAAENAAEAKAKEAEENK